MSVNIQKGQRVDLTKGSGGLAGIMVGLGWDPVAPPARKGLFGGSAKAPEVDCDASVIMLDENGKFTNRDHVVYYGHLTSNEGSIKHMGDNITGQGEGDDEQIMVDLSRVPPNIHKLVFVVTIYDAVKRKQDFGLIQNAFIRIVNTANNQEVLKFNLSDDYAGRTEVVAGEVYRHQGEWKFAAIGEGTNFGTLSEVLKRYT